MANLPQDFIDREGYQDPTSLVSKYIHAGDESNGQPYAYFDENGISLVGDRKHVITVDPTFGVLLGGPISFSAMPDQLSFGGGYFRLNPLVLSTIPSTTPTPVPVLVKSTPKLLEGSSNISGMLSGLESSLGI
jgi:hypothetical protein